MMPSRLIGYLGFLTTEEAASKMSAIQCEKDAVVLTDGTTAFTTFNKKGDGDWIVFITGHATPQFAWKPVAELMAEKGFRCLTYDHYGRGESSRPYKLPDGKKIKHEIELYVRQLKELTSCSKTGIGKDTKFHLMGWSMGAIVATYYAFCNEGNLLSLGLNAPGLYKKIGLFDRLLMFLTPYVGLLYPIIECQMLNRLERDHFYKCGNTQDNLEELIEKFRQGVKAQFIKEKLARKAFFHALADSARNLIKDLDHPEEWPASASIPKSVIFWGKKDEVAHFVDRHCQVVSLLTDSDSSRCPKENFYDNAAHAPQYQFSKRFADDYTSFIDSL